jgi:hypothetical protein
VRSSLVSSGGHNASTVVLSSCLAKRTLEVGRVLQHVQGTHSNSHQHAVVLTVGCPGGFPLACCNHLHSCPNLHTTCE